MILLYHHVDGSTPPITSIQPAQFERHLQILEEEGFEVHPLDELVRSAMSGEDPASKRVAITFDDAYISIYETAFPMLKARGWPFTIFVATDYVSDTNPHYLSWVQLQEMHDNGASIQNHTLSHAHLLRLDAGETQEAWRSRVRQEITGAQAALKARGYESTQFAYTYGEYNLEILAMLADTGLQGFGQQSGAVGPYSNPLLLPRFPMAGIYVGENAFRDKIRSLALPVSQPEPEPLITDTLRPVLELSFQESVNINRMTCYGPGGLANIALTGNQTARVVPAADLPVGRSRYNCTLPAGDGRFYWFSQLYIRKRPDGSWYPEP